MRTILKGWDTPEDYAEREAQLQRDFDAALKNFRDGHLSLRSRLRLWAKWHPIAWFWIRCAMGFFLVAAFAVGMLAL
jgi:hypothetical protein